MTEPLLRVEHLQVAFRLGQANGTARRVEAVGRAGQGVSFDVPEHRTVALVGESGSGKTVSAMSSSEKRNSGSPDALTAVTCTS
jgi:peptide/nickel transport system ATP-binding protein